MEQRVDGSMHVLPDVDQINLHEVDKGGQDFLLDLLRFLEPLFLEQQVDDGRQGVLHQVLRHGLPLLA